MKLSFRVMGKFSSDQDVLLFVGVRCCVLVCFTLFSLLDLLLQTSTTQPIGSIYRCANIASLGQIRALIFYIVPSSLFKSLARRTMGRGCKLDRELFPYWTTCLMWSTLGKRGEILVINFQMYGIYKTTGKHVI